MSDQLPNAYSTFPNNFPQGPPAQQAQHRPPQQPQQVVGISSEVWQQMQYRNQQQQQHQQHQQQQQQQQLQQPRQQQQQQQQQQQSQQSGGELMQGGVMSPQQQIIQALRSQVHQGNMTQQQALERLAMMQASAHSFQEQSVPQQLPPGFNAGAMPSGTTQQQLAAMSQRAQVSANNQINTLQRVIQAQDPSHARQFNMLLPGQQQQQQQQQNGSGIASRMGQNFNPSGMGLPQGPGSLHQNFIQQSPSVPHANPQPSSTPSASQIPQPGAQQVSGPSGNLADVPLPQLRALSTQLQHVVMEGEKNLQATSSSGEGDIQRQQLRNKIELNRQRLRALQEVIHAKLRASGDPTQQTVNGPSWPGSGQRPNGLYPVAERPGQNNSPSLRQASVNQAPPQRGIPTPQQNFVSSAPQSNLTPISSHVSANGPPSNSVLAQMNGAPPQQSPQVAHPPSQPPIQPNKLPGLSEDRFKINFMQFARTKGIRLAERDLVIDGRPINLWALHRAVFSRNCFESVTAHDEWPVIGVALGFPPVAGGDPGRPPRCGPLIAQRLQQLYNDVLRHFDQVYISTIVARLRNSQASGQLLPQPPQPQAQAHQPTEADYQALLASITSETSVTNAETMGILPRFSHTSGAELEAHHVPQHVITFVEQNREHLQRAAQDQNGFRAGLTSTKNAPLDNRTQANHAPVLQALARPQQFIPSHQQPQQHLQRQGLVQAPGKPNTLQSAQLFNSGSLVPPSTTQTINVSSMQSMGAQIPSSNSSNGVQNQGGPVPVSMNPAAMNGVTSGSILAQPASTMPVRRLNKEDLLSAKRWIEEKKRIAFSSVPNFDKVAPIQPIPESDIQEYQRNLERLDQVLVTIERYIHFAFAALKKEDVVERLFNMMASAKSQLEELRRPNPRYVLELHTIRGMIQEADNMDKGLKDAIQKTQAQLMAHNGVPPQPPPQPPSASTSALFAPTAPPATAPVSRPPHAAPAHRKKPSQAQAISTPTPPPIPVASTPTPQAATPGITAPSPQTPKSPKGKAAPRPKPPARRKASTKANSVETPTPAHTVTSTPSSSTPVDAKGGGKRARDDETDAPTPGVTSAPSPKRVKTDWEGPPNEEARKRDEQAENVKTDDQAMKLFEHVTKFIDENPESAEAASNALDAILRTYPSVPDMDDATIPPSFSFGDLPPTSPPHPVGNDMFLDYINYSAFDDPTPELVAGSSTNPSPESASDQDHPGRAGPSPQISNAKPDGTHELLRPAMWKDIAGGDLMFHQAQGWKWEGQMDTPDQPWAISTS